MSKELVADSNEDGNWFVMTDDRGLMVDVAAICKMNGHGEEMAHLFAAAPDLLAALRGIAEDARRAWADGDAESAMVALGDIERAALAAIATTGAA